MLSQTEADEDGGDWDGKEHERRIVRLRVICWVCVVASIVVCQGLRLVDSERYHRQDWDEKSTKRLRLKLRKLQRIHVRLACPLMTAWVYLKGSCPARPKMPPWTSAPAAAWRERGNRYCRESTNRQKQQRRPMSPQRNCRDRWKPALRSERHTIAMNWVPWRGRWWQRTQWAAGSWAAPRGTWWWSCAGRRLTAAAWWCRRTGSWTWSSWRCCSGGACGQSRRVLASSHRRAPHTPSLGTWWRSRWARWWRSSTAAACQRLAKRTRRTSDCTCAARVSESDWSDVCPKLHESRKFVKTTNDRVSLVIARIAPINKMISLFHQIILKNLKMEKFWKIIYSFVKNCPKREMILMIHQIR